MTITKKIHESIDAMLDYEQAKLEYEASHGGEFKASRRGGKLYDQMVEADKKVRQEIYHD